jgi:hypothetical protein
MTSKCASEDSRGVDIFIVKNKWIDHMPSQETLGKLHQELLHIQKSMGAQVPHTKQFSICIYSHYILCVLLIISQ